MELPWVTGNHIWVCRRWQVSIIYHMFLYGEEKVENRWLNPVTCPALEFLCVAADKWIIQAWLEYLLNDKLTTFQGSSLSGWQRLELFLPLNWNPFHFLLDDSSSIHKRILKKFPTKCILKCSRMRWSAIWDWLQNKWGGRRGYRQWRLAEYW